MTALDTYSTRAADAPRKRRGSLMAILAMLAIAIVLLADALWIEPYRIEVTHFDIQGNVTSPIKIAHLTDLHTNGLGRRERHVLSILDQEKPDIILITGDSLSAWDPSYSEVQEVYEKAARSPGRVVCARKFRELEDGSARARILCEFRRALAAECWRTCEARLVARGSG